MSDTREAYTYRDTFSTPVVFLTCDANEKFGPGDLFFPPMGPEGPGFVAPFLFRRLAEGRVVSIITQLFGYSSTAHLRGS